MTFAGPQSRRSRTCAAAIEDGTSANAAAKVDLSGDVLAFCRRVLGIAGWTLDRCKITDPAESWSFDVLATPRDSTTFCFIAS